MLEVRVAVRVYRLIGRQPGLLEIIVTHQHCNAKPDVKKVVKDKALSRVLRNPLPETLATV